MPGKIFSFNLLFSILISPIFLSCSSPEIISSEPQFEMYYHKNQFDLKAKATLNPDSVKLFEKVLTDEIIKLSFSATINGFGEIEKVVNRENISTDVFILDVPITKENIRFSLAGLDQNGNKVIEMIAFEKFTGPREVYVDWISTGAFRTLQWVKGQVDMGQLNQFVKEMTGYSNKDQFSHIYFDVKGLADIINNEMGIPENITDEMKKSVKTSIRVKVNSELGSFGVLSTSLQVNYPDSRIAKVSADEYFIEGILPGTPLTVFGKNEISEKGNVYIIPKPGSNIVEINLSTKNNISETNFKHISSKATVIKIEPSPIPEISHTAKPIPVKSETPKIKVTPTPVPSNSSEVKVTFVSNSPNFSQYIYIIDLKTNKTTKYGGIESQNFMNLEWSPDGKNIIYENRSTLPILSPDKTKYVSQINTKKDGVLKIELVVSNFDGTASRQITNNTTANVGQGWSPDSKKVIFMAVKIVDTLKINFFKSNIKTVDIESGKEDYVTNGDSYDGVYYYSPDGKKIAYGSVNKGDHGSRIYITNSDGSGKPELLGDFYGHSPAWSPDGTKIAFIKE